MQPLNEAIATRFREIAERLDRENQLLSRARLDAYYTAFRRRFGPDVLANLDGETLLQTMHARKPNDSMAYWLEFKNDDEFPARFGGIGGGSALKFGLFYSEVKGTWVTGSTTKLEEITVERAIEIARRQRDEILLGAQILSRFAPSTDDADYEKLQRELEAAAPTTLNSVWAHKYFSLLFPDRLDDFHNPDYARFHLIKLLQLPPSVAGRYVAGGRFVALSDQFGLPMNSTTSALSEMNGRKPYSYWRIGTREGDRGPSRWDMMRGGHCIAIAWPKLGDLSALLLIADASERRTEVRERVSTHYAEIYNYNERVISNQATQINAFLSAIVPGDVVVAMDGMNVLGIGKVTGDYRFRAEDPFPHQRPVDWLSHDHWEMSPPEQLLSTVRLLGKHPQHLVEVETRIIDKAPIVGPIIHDGPPDPTPPPALPDVPARVQSVLERKKQVILYGPPGTGKTFWAEIAARELAARSWFGRAAAQLTDAEGTEITSRAVRMCAFHPAYGYEDFLEGYRPELVDGQMTFQRRDGVFKRLCAEAEAVPDRSFFLIIDEINRGDIPRIFGELLTVLEADKRGKPILLPLSGSVFRVPPNVFLVGTMNTADRSIALLDAALRRRFGFIELLPDSSTLGDTVLAGLPLRRWLDALNRSIVAHVGRDGRSLQIGHSYLLSTAGQPLADMRAFIRVLEQDIVPLLQEYCYEDFKVLASILGPGLVDVQEQRIRAELFASDSQDDLVSALIAPHTEIATAVFTSPATGETTEDLESKSSPDESEDDESGGYESEPDPLAPAAESMA